MIAGSVEEVAKKLGILGRVLGESKRTVNDGM